MSKFYGPVGFITIIETAPGIYEEVATERFYYGDVVREARRLERGDKVNDGLNVNNSFSLMGDAHAFRSFMDIRYLVWEGVPWKVTDVEVRPPRLIFSIGGLYNGARASATTP